jgi:hypothetical protein
MNRHWLSWHEATELAKYDIPVPPKAAMPKGFAFCPAIKTGFV